MAEHLLYFGRAQWKHVTHRINATARVPQHSLRDAVNTICAAWSNDAEAKFSVNSLIGCLGIRKQRVLSVTSSTSPMDRPDVNCTETKCVYANCTVYDWATSCQLVGSLNSRSRSSPRTWPQHHWTTRRRLCS